jgi:hypothetical protein
MELMHPRLAAMLAAITLSFVILLPAGASAQSTLSGVYKVDGKAAALTQIVAYTGQPESGQPTTVLVFSTKDQGKDAKAAFDALFGKFGDALVVKVFPDGKVYSTDLVHASLDSPSGSAQIFGTVTIKDFKSGGGEISGELTSGGPRDLRNQKWEVDLTFKTKAP